MDKTHNISLGGFAFNIDDSAYVLLSKYLKDIKISVGNVAGADEIMSDVEYRMAELLRERMGHREVVNKQDIDYLISVMGEPEEFYSDELADEEEVKTKTKSNNSYTHIAKKKWFRDPDDTLLGGVCSGIAHYIGMEPVWVRLFLLAIPFLDFMFLGIYTASFFIIYVILWAVVPEAKTTADKLEMRGEPVNIDSIKEFFEKSSENIQESLKGVEEDARNFANTTTPILERIVKAIAKVSGILFLIFLLIIAISLFLVFFVVVFGISLSILNIDSVYYLDYVVDGIWGKIALYVSLFLVLVIPVIGLILLAMRIVSKRYSVPRFIKVVLPILWVIGLIGLGGVMLYVASDFRTKVSEVKTVNLPTNAKTIIMEKVEDGDVDWEEMLSSKPNYLTLNNTGDLIVKKSTKGFNYMEIKYIGRGGSRMSAKGAIKGIEYNYQVQDSLVRLDDRIYLKEGFNWRKQEVDIILYLTEDTQVVFRDIDDVEVKNNGKTDWIDADSENIYKFEGDDFRCLNCKVDNPNYEVEGTFDSNNIVDNLNEIIDGERKSVNIDANKDSINIKIK